MVQDYIDCGPDDAERKYWPPRSRFFDAEAARIRGAAHDSDGVKSYATYVCKLREQIDTLRKENNRYRRAMRVIANRPGVGEVETENEHMADIAQATLEGEVHYSVQSEQEKD